MSSLVESVLRVKKQLSAEKRMFSLFALFLREDAPEKWDLVISSPWVEADKEAALNLISSKVRKVLTPAELLAVSRIVFVDPMSPSVQAINRAFHVEDATVEVRDRNFFGLAIRHAHIFASVRADSTVSARPAPNKSLRRERRERVRR